MGTHLPRGGGFRNVALDREAYCAHDATAMSCPPSAGARNLEVRYVVRQVLDVVVGERGRDAGHVARVVRPPPRLEIVQLLLDVLRVLARHLGYLVLADKAAHMAH